jgi:hypothetical protein
MKVMKHEIGAFVLAALPFVVKIGDRSVETINGVAQVRWDYNYAGIVLGIIALVVVYAGQRDLKESIELEDEPRAPHYAIFAAIALLAIYQIAKGAFLI